jgi:hypothetical protein
MTERGAAPPGEEHLRELKASADHARQRHDLYKAKSYGPKPTSPERLRELKRESERAISALERARISARPATQGGADA